MARKILLADDSVTAQNMGRKILTDAGYEVVTVNNGSAALKKMAESKPDLIVLDVYMPGYSGLEVCQRIKENRETARIPVLLTVGKLEPFKPEEARRARADAFVVKPFEASELLSALTKLEDKIIPQPEPYKQGRFAKAVASVEQDAEGTKFGDSDSGWKARLRIPSGPQRHDSEPGPDYVATQGKGFRDFIEKPSAKEQPKPAPTSGGFERPLPKGVPHDITPEEIAAITAAAARLSGAPKARESSGEESLKPVVDAVIETPPAEAIEEAAPVTFASSPSIPGSPSEEISSPAHAVPDVEIGGLAEVETTDETGDGATPTAHPLESVPHISAPLAADEANTPDYAVPVQEPDPTASLAAEATQATPPETEVEPNTEEAAQPTESSHVVQATVAQTMPVPSVADDEVMAALQTLIPSSASDSTPPQSQHERGSSAFAALTGTVDAPNPQTYSTGPHWIAVEVETTADEANLSLEEEMGKDHATHKAPWPGMPDSTAASEPSLAAPNLEMPQTPTPEPADQNTVYAMASAAAAGEAAPVPWTASSNVSAVHERPALESPVVFAERALDPETAAGPPVAADTDTEIVGETEIMAANWKNIRDSIAGAAAKPAPSKEDFQETEVVKPEPADTPAAEKASSSPAATDPTAIASIVDSVLAELRPKIVEEIARKLADPKKS